MQFKDDHPQFHNLQSLIQSVCVPRSHFIVLQHTHMPANEVSVLFTLNPVIQDHHAQK